MRVVDALRDIQRTQELLDPASSRFVTGSVEEQEQARREWRKHMFAREVLRSDRTEIPRSELVPRAFGILEHTSSRNDDYYVKVGGDLADPAYLPNATAYCVDESALPILLARPSAGPQSRRELEHQESERAARRNAPKAKPAWMTRS